MQVVADDSRVGTIVGGRYRLTERLAEGGMGIVYKGERLVLGRPVAIKFLLEPFAQDAQFMARFEREAFAMSQLSHPNCVSVIDFGFEGAPYIVMDFVTGKTLRKLLCEGPVPMGRALHIARQLLASLAHAHNQGIVHRDIKPGNIMLSEATGMGDHVRIFDFGLAKLLETHSANDLSRSNIALGTPAYMSPEQTMGSHVDARSDLYSAGIVLFELLTGRKPFHDDNALALMQMHREQEPPTLAQTAPSRNYSRDLEAVVARALAKEPSARFQTAGDFAKALFDVPEARLAPYGDQSIPTSAAFASACEAPTQDLTVSRVLTRKRRSILVASVIGAVALCSAGYIVVRTLRGEHVAHQSAPTQAGSHSLEIMAVHDASQPKPAESTADVENASVASEPSLEASNDRAPDFVPPTLELARELMAARKWDDAIDALRELRRTHSAEAIYPALIAEVYFERHWYKDSLEQYRDAIRLDPAYRANKELNERLIAMLVFDKIHDKVRYVLINEIGPPALPFLRHAAIADPNLRIRRRATSAAQEISKK